MDPKAFPVFFILVGCIRRSLHFVVDNHGRYRYISARMELVRVYVAIFPHVSRVPKARDYSSRGEVKAAPAGDQHPLSIVASNLQQLSSSKVSDPLNVVDPLRVADPLSASALSGGENYSAASAAPTIDLPISAAAALASSTVHEDRFVPWVDRTAGILQKFTTNANIPVPVHFENHVAYF